MRTQPSVLALVASSLIAVSGLAASACQGQSAAAADRRGAGDNAAATAGQIDAVTVFRGQALVTRVIDIPGGTGLREIIVTDLPGAILPGSLYAESSDGIEVRSVSYRIRPVVEDTRESVRQAEKAVRDARDALAAAQSRQQYLEWQRQYLDKLEGFVAPTAQVELTRGVLNAETLKDLTMLVTAQRKAQSDDGHKLALEVRTLTETLQLRERELAVLTASSSRTAREAVVFINATKPGARLRLSYLVSGANWSPSYNLRLAGADAKAATLEYQASVQQMSGEDWNGVQLTLSTATPALVATGPALMPLQVALVAPRQDDSRLAMLRDEGYVGAKKALEEKQREMERTRNVQVLAVDVLRAGNAPASGRAGEAGGLQAGQTIGGLSQGDFDGQVAFSLDKGLNEIADQSQILDLISTAKVERKSKAEPLAVRQGDEGLSVTYRVASRTTMPSRADQQLIQISQMQLPAEVVKIATPTLTQYIYNEARVTNAGSTVLLAGPASSYVGGEFVGSAVVPTVSAGESFRVGFGIDSSLRAAKELVERTETTQGGNRIVEFTYRLTIENFGSVSAPIRLMDRLPNPAGTEIKLTLIEPATRLSEDKDYLETGRKKNLLRWDVTAPAGATGTKAFAVEYKFRLEFDRQMTLSENR